jgi:acyl-CoA thioester hydrolase
MELARMSEHQASMAGATTKQPAIVNETRIRVRYAETDQMGVVYHSNFYIWFEIGRVELFRQLGFAYKDMEQKDDCFIVVAESKCRHVRPARYDDVLRVRTRIAEARTRTIRFEYEVLNDATCESLATGETLHVICGKDGRPKPLPAPYRKLFGVVDPAHSAHARAKT